MISEHLAQISKTSGVLGSCICSRTGEIIANNMPDIYDWDTIIQASKMVVESYLAVETLRDQITELDFVYEDYICIVRPVNDYLLYVICEAEVKTPILKLGLNVAAKKIASLPRDVFIESAAAVRSQVAQEKTATSSDEELYVSADMTAAASDGTLDPEAVGYVITAIQEYLEQAMGETAGRIIVDTAIDAAGVDRQAPDRAKLRIALNELLNKALTNVMGKGDAVRWLNELLETYGLTRKD
jgi:predicted regulator of Ras-like GTPase activity (Roadblock/LC7/MglB family)